MATRRPRKKNPDYGWMLPKRARGGSDGPPVYRPGSKDDDEDDKSPKPLGVPEGYTTPFTRGLEPRTSADAAAGRAERGFGPGTIGQRGPRYFAGDEFRPASLDPAGIGELQAMMAATGMLNDFRYGVWDGPSRKAYKALLREANAAGITAEAALNQRAQGIAIGGRGGGGSGGSGGGGGRFELDENGEPVWVEETFVPDLLTLQLPNRDDLRRVFRTAVIDKLGVGMSQADIDAMADNYIAQLRMSQTANYNQRVAVERAEFMGGRGGGGETIEETEPASPETYLENELMRRDPEGTQAAGIVNEWIPRFVEMMGGWS